MIGPGRSGREDSEFRRFHYPGTETLINLLGIRDPKRLEVAERRLVRTRLREGLPRAADPRTYPGLVTIHHHLFQDVFGWAGQERTYTTGRGPAPSPRRRTSAPGWRSSSPCSASSISSGA
jgi:fido (protein-threonine AMPylation protein)